jgi:hypothetical protein
VEEGGLSGCGNLENSKTRGGVGHMSDGGFLGMTGLGFADPGAPMWRRPALYEPCSLAGGGEAYSFEATVIKPMSAWIAELKRKISR